MDRVARGIECDSTLSAQVLQLVNSPMFAFRNQIGGLRHAIALLGADRVSAALIAALLRSWGLSEGAAQRCWRHSLATAAI